MQSRDVAIKVVYLHPLLGIGGLYPGTIDHLPDVLPGDDLKHCECLITPGSPSILSNKGGKHWIIKDQGVGECLESRDGQFVVFNLCFEVQGSKDIQ